MPRRLAAIVFTDIAGYTSLSQKDERAALALLREQERLVRPLLEIHRGRLVKAMGDGLLVEFSNALDAVACAVDLQQHIHERNARELPPKLRVRIGIHLGDVEDAGSDILGDAVNVASRIEPLAEQEGICLSSQVYESVRGKLPHSFDGLGPKTLKGVQHPVDVYRVVMPWSASAAGSSGNTAARLAVLPFSNISPDPNDAYFADGLTEELISALSLIRGLRVISRTSVGQYRGSTKPVTQIGAELGVSSILEGSVRKAGNRLRVTVQLIDVATDEHRWSQSYDHQLDDIFATQSEIADHTARALKLELLDSARAYIAEEPTSNLAAYEASLRGLEAMRRIPFREAYKEAIRHFEEAMRLDPNYAAALAATAVLLVGSAGETHAPREVFPRARELASRAAQLNPRSSAAHLALGFVAMQADLDWAAAEKEFRTSIELNPSASAAHVWLANQLTLLQRFDEALPEARAAIELDPLSPYPLFALLSAQRARRDLAGVAATLDQMAAKFPGSESVDFARAGLLIDQGRLDEAERVLARFRDDPSFDARGQRAYLLAVAGKPGELREMLRRIREVGQAPEYVARVRVAEAYLAAGDRDTCLTLLEEDWREGERMLWFHYLDRIFDLIRDEPRFVALLQAFHLPTQRPPSVEGASTVGG